MAGASHVAVVPLPVYGHLNPLLQLSIKLASRGITVSFILTHTTLHKTSHLIGSFVEDPNQEQLVHQNIKFLTIADERDNLAGDIWASLLFVQAKGGEIHDLIQKSAQEHGLISCLIMDSLLVPLLAPVSTKLAVPQAVFWTASSTFLLLNIHLRTLVQKGFVPLGSNSDDETLQTLDHSVVPGIPEELNLKVREDIPLGWHEEDSMDPGFEKRSMFRETIFEASYVLLNTFQELENESLSAMQQLGVQVLAVGPLVPMNNPTVHEEFDGLFSWLSSKPAASVVYVSFGTIARMNDIQQVQELASALEELCNSERYFFLWIVHEGVQSMLPEGYEERLCGKSRRGFLSSWCPQLQVLRHRSVGVFLTHCGWNSTLESLCSGVPMVAWPCLVEQNLNGKFVEDVWKVGRRIHKKSSQELRESIIPRKHIVTVVTGVMEDGDMRERATKWKREAERATGVGGSSRGNIEKLIACTTKS